MNGPTKREAPNREAEGHATSNVVDADRDSLTEPFDVLRRTVTRTTTTVETTEVTLTRSFVRGKDGAPIHLCGCPGRHHDDGCQVGQPVPEPSPCTQYCSQLTWEQLREEAEHGCRFVACPNFWRAS